MQFSIRKLYELEPDDYQQGVVDFTYTGNDGIVRYSPDVYANEEEAKKAIDALFSHWDSV